MVERKPDINVRCEECGFIIGGCLPSSADGSRSVQRLGQDSNCKHPPINNCPSAKTAFSKALASTRKVR